LQPGGEKAFKFAIGLLPFFATPHAMLSLSVRRITDEQSRVQIRGLGRPSHLSPRPTWRQAPSPSRPRTPLRREPLDDRPLAGISGGEWRTDPLGRAKAGCNRPQAL